MLALITIIPRTHIADFTATTDLGRTSMVEGGEAMAGMGMAGQVAVGQATDGRGTAGEAMVGKVMAGEAMVGVEIEVTRQITCLGDSQVKSLSLIGFSRLRKQ